MPWGRKAGGYQAREDVEWLVACLGNPGARYACTPHNVGFLVADALRSAHRIPVIAKHDGLFGVGCLADDIAVAVLTPLTFMNLSGRSVRPALAAHGLGAERLIVVHDEIDLAFGSLQVKVGGGLAGHNGLRSISELVGTRDFVRLRVGVGRPGPSDRRPIRDWILAPWDQSDAEVEGLVDDARTATEVIVSRGARAAMNTINTATPPTEAPRTGRPRSSAEPDNTA